MRKFLYILVTAFVFILHFYIIASGQQEKPRVSVENILLSKTSDAAVTHVRLDLKTSGVSVLSAALYFYDRESKKWVSAGLKHNESENTWEGVVSIPPPEDEIAYFLSFQNEDGKLFYVLPEDEVDGLEDISFPLNMQDSDMTWLSFCQGETVKDAADSPGSLDIASCDFAFDNENLILRIKASGKIPATDESRMPYFYAVEFKERKESGFIYSAYYSPFIGDSNTADWPNFTAVQLPVSAFAKASLTQDWLGWDSFKLKITEEIESETKGDTLYLKIPKSDFPGTDAFMEMPVLAALYGSGGSKDFMVGKFGAVTVESFTYQKSKTIRLQYGYTRSTKDSVASAANIMFCTGLTASVGN